jgi:arylamine N-acetyltransferase
MLPAAVLERTLSDLGEGWAGERRRAQRRRDLSPDHRLDHAGDLMCARSEPDRRYALLNRNFTIRYRNGQVERRAIVDAAELHKVLTSDFRVILPEEDSHAAWDRIREASV